jgi:hypothetical protein
VKNDFKEATRRLKKVMRQRCVTSSELARVAGISVGTFYNICCGNANSRRARQVISEYLAGAQIWNDIQPTKRCSVFKRGTSIEFQSVEDAKQWAKEFPGVAKRQGKVITFTETCSYTVSLSPDDPEPRVVREEFLAATAPQNKSRESETI